MQNRGYFILGITNKSPPRRRTRVARGPRPPQLAMGFMALFKKKEPKDLVREWQTKIRTEMRGVDRQIRGTVGK
jgi:hypothetical protein